LEGEELTRQTRDDNIKPAVSSAAPSNLLLPEMVELSTVEPELSIDADSDDWLTGLLRYDDENADDNNSGDS